jgi:hypothetical protein
MKVLDLFGCEEGWSKSFKDRGHEILTLDFDKKFNPNICAYILTVTSKNLEKFVPFDIVVASSRCQCFPID